MAKIQQPYSLAEFRGSYLGFTYNGIHSSRLGIVRTSRSNRYDDSSIPQTQTKTSSVPGQDGSYLFVSQYQPKSFTIDFAFDNMTDIQLRELRKLFGQKNVHDLIFDEAPYKIYSAAVTGTTSIKHLSFPADLREEVQREPSSEGLYFRQDDRFPLNLANGSRRLENPYGMLGINMTIETGEDYNYLIMNNGGDTSVGQGLRLFLNDLNLEVGKSYTFSVMAYGEDNNQKLYFRTYINESGHGSDLQLNFKTSSGEQYGSSSKSLTLTTSPEQYWCTFEWTQQAEEVLSNFSGVNVYLVASEPYVGEGRAKVYLYQPMLQEGTFCTPWRESLTEELFASLTTVPELKNKVIYKGEGTVQFTCYYPFARSRDWLFNGDSSRIYYKTLNDYIIDTRPPLPEWANKVADELPGSKYGANSTGVNFDLHACNLGEWRSESGLRVGNEENSYDTVTIPNVNPESSYNIKTWNCGDIPADWTLEIPIGWLGKDTILSVDDAELKISSGEAFSGDTKLLIDSKTELVYGLNANGKTGTIYNRLVSGIFFKIPLGENEFTVTNATFAGGGTLNLNYSYLYY